MRRLSLAWVLCLLAACARHGAASDDAVVAPLPTRAEIWAAIQPLAERYRMEPAFLYALVAAESDFNPRARNGDARGLLQLKPRSWRAVSAAPYEPTVWDWRANLAAGVDYLAYSRSYLHKQGGVTFSNRLLLAAFHYGIDYVEERRFELRRIPVPESAIYAELWRGNLAPVAPPN